MDDIVDSESSGRLCPLTLPSTSPCRIVRWIAEPGSRVRKGTVLVTYTTDLSTAETEDEVPLKASLVGVVKEKMFEEGEIVQPGVPVVVLEDKCDHSIVVYDMCTDCGFNLRSLPGARKGVFEGELANVTVVHGIPGIRISQKEAEALGRKDKLRLLSSRKLALIVDLDQTLIHTSVDPNIESGIQDVFGFKLPGHPMLYHCRLRPYARQFLERISKLYEMHVFTMGTNSYAASITKILDPARKLFCDRIISRDECFDPFSKVLRLKSVFPCGDEMVAIIDDREDVWSRCPNLVHVKPYVFFAGTADINAPPTRPSAPPTSTTTDLSRPDSMPFKVRHMTSSKNNITTPVSVATPHHPGKPAPQATVNSDISDNAPTAAKDTLPDGALMESSNQVNKSQSDNGCSTNEFDKGGDKANEPTQSPLVGECDDTGDDPSAQLNNNDNNNNNGDDPKTTKEDDSSSSSGSSSSSDEEEKGEGEGQNGGDSSSSSSSGIDDNLFDSLDEKVEGDAGGSGGDEKMEESASTPADVGKMEVETSEKVDVIRGASGEGGTVKEGEGVDHAIKEQIHIAGTAQQSEPPPLQPSQPSKIRRRSVEVKDPDNFLIYLGDILERLHDGFYKEFDEMAKGLNIEEVRNIPTPDLKKLIPELRHSVLKGTRLLFTGVIPTNMPSHKNREWNTARAFGAIIHDRLVPGLHSSDPNKAFKATTHVVAGRPGTSKLREAKRLPGIKVVNPRWLWACAEQWRLADEKLFPLEFDKDEAKHQMSENKVKRKSASLKPPRKVMKVIPEEDKPLPESSASQQPSKTESTLVTEMPLDSTSPDLAVKDTERDSDSESDDDDAFMPTGRLDRDLEQDTTMLQRLREFKRHMSLESRLSVSDEELEKMDAEVEAEISSNSSNSSANDEELGTFIEDKDDDTLLSYENYAGSEASNGDKTDPVVTVRLSRKRKHIDIEHNSNSSNSPSLEQLLNESVEPSDDEENDNDSDSDDSIDELGALLG